MAEESSNDKLNAEPAVPDGLADDLDASVLIGDGSFPILSGDSPFEFAFSYCGVPFRTQVRPYGGSVRMRIAGDVAPPPYTAECQAARLAILAFLRNCRDFVWGERGATSQQHIVVQGEAEIHGPVTPVQVVSAVTGFVLAARPCMNILAENLPRDYDAKPSAQAE